MKDRRFNRTICHDMDSTKIFHILDLDYPGLEKVKIAYAEGRERDAFIEIKKYFSEQKRLSLFIEDDENTKLVSLIKNQYKCEAERVIERANQVVQQSFVFQEAWDMERTNIPVTFDKAIEWDYVPYEDQEWAYMLNRHRYWITLGQAFLLTKNEIYLHAYSRQIGDWILSNPTPSSMETNLITWRTIEAGIRCSNWINTLPYFIDRLEPELFTRILVSVYEQMEYLIPGYDRWRAVSNWGVLENHGLFKVALTFPEFKNSDQWMTLSIERLKETAFLQVMKDGIHWEQSPMYHNEVLLSYLDVIYLSNKHKVSLSPIIVDIAQKMAFADLFMAKPNHCQPMKGDSDNFDLRDVLTMSSIIFKDGVLKTGGYERIDYQNLWNFGIEGKQIYESIEPIEPASASASFEHSGNFFMRSGWNKEDLYLFFHCGQLGGGHGHADLLHFDIHAYGKDLLTDQGRYNYSDSCELRKQLKQGSAHNTTLVDNIDFTEYIDTWSYGRVANPTATKWITDDLYDYVEGSHNGYWHLEDPVHVQRRILFVKPYYWVLLDEFFCKGQHSFSQFFHFPPGKVEVNHMTKNVSTLFEDEANLHIFPITENVEVQLKKGFISYEYNAAEENFYTEYSLVSKGFTPIMHVLFPQRSNNDSIPVISKVDILNIAGDLVLDNEALACKILFPDSSIEHIIVICFKPPSHHSMSYIVDGTQIFSEVTLIKRSNKEEVIVVK